MQSRQNKGNEKLKMPLKLGHTTEKVYILYPFFGSEVGNNQLLLEAGVGIMRKAIQVFSLSESLSYTTSQSSVIQTFGK